MTDLEKFIELVYRHPEMIHNLLMIVKEADEQKAQHEQSEAT